MAISNVRTAVVALALLICGAGNASSQIVYGQPTSGSANIVYTHWTLESGGEEVTISQVAFPLSGFVPLKENFDAQFYIGGSSSSLESGATDFSLGGLSDFRIQVNRSFRDDHWVLSAGLNLPTGKKELSLSDEWQLVQALSQDFLTFPVRRLGEGFGLNLLLGGATMVGEYRAGAGIGYTFLAPYTPYEGGNDYNPGDVVNVYGGIDTDRGSMNWAAQISHTLYTTDQFQDVKTFKQGAMTQFSFIGQRASEKVSLGGHMTYLLRGRNQRYAFPAESLIDQLKLFGNEFSVGLDAGIAAAPLWVVAPYVSARFIQANEEALGKSKIFGLGSGVTRTIGAGQVEARLGWYTGDADGGTIDLSGLQISGGARVTF